MRTITCDGDHKMDTEKATALYTELWEHLKSLNDKSLKIQTSNANAAVRYLSAAVSDEEKEAIIRTYYDILFPARGGLSDVVLWDNDFLDKYPAAIHPDILPTFEELYFQSGITL